MLHEFNIIDYETRIKRFADSSNHGFISDVQLKEAFKGTGIFQNLGDPHSVTSRFILSSYVADFAIGSTLPIEGPGEPVSPRTRGSKSKSAFTKNTKYMTIVDIFLQQISEQAEAKKQPETGLD